MGKEKKVVKIQIRITPTEKVLLNKLISANKELTISRIFRDNLHATCEKLGIKVDEIKTEGIGNLTVG